VFNVEIVGKLPVPPLARSFIGSAPTHDIAPTAERQETEKRSVAFINFGGGIPESSNESRRRHAMLHPRCWRSEFLYLGSFIVYRPKYWMLRSKTADCMVRE